jgi:hypothetical protein
MTTVRMNITSTGVFSGVLLPLKIEIPANMDLRKGVVSLLFFLAPFLLVAQQTTVFTEANLSYKRGVDFFNQNVYGLAQKEFRIAMDLLRPVNEPEWRPLKTDAELYHAKCAVRLGTTGSRKTRARFPARKRTLAGRPARPHSKSGTIISTKKYDESPGRTTTWRHRWFGCPCAMKFVSKRVQLFRNQKVRPG